MVNNCFAGSGCCLDAANDCSRGGCNQLSLAYRGSGGSEILNKGFIPTTSANDGGADKISEDTNTNGMNGGGNVSNAGDQGHTKDQPQDQQLKRKTSSKSTGGNTRSRNQTTNTFDVITDSGFSWLKAPGDGNCLFNAITLGLEKRIGISSELRRLIAGVILSDTRKYNSDFLVSAQTPEAYAKWIQGDGEWGGIPELKILAGHYNKMICVVDIGWNRIHKFGNPSTADHKIFLIYDGTHYNLGVQKDPRTNEIRRKFKISEENDKNWLEFAKLLKDSGSVHINPEQFQLQC